jgi:hypothetical protein
MKSILSLALIFALTSSATVIDDVRQARIKSYSYTVTTVESNGLSMTLTSPRSGIVNAYFSPSDRDYLTYAGIRNPDDNVQCTLKDRFGYQVRAFGGPNQDVDSVELVKADGIQVFSLSCVPV